MKKRFIFLAWWLEIKLSKLHGNERVMFLLNRLLDEIEANGINVTGTSAKVFFSVCEFDDNKLILDSHHMCLEGKRGEYAGELKER